MIRLGFLFTISCLLCLSCFEDSIIDTTTITGGTTPISRFIHNISGIVIDEEGEAIAAATISLGEQVTMSNSLGQFELKGIEIGEEGVFIGASQLGYLTAGSRAYQSSSLKSDVTIVLLDQPAITSSFSSNIGGEIVSDDGVALQFPPNSITHQGTVFDGEVYVSILYQDLTDLPVEQYTLRNNLIKSDGPSKKILSSAVALEVTLMDEQGRKLNIADGQSVSTRIPLPQVVNDNQDIKLYGFSPTSGFFEEEQAVSILNQVGYVDIPHFSWWVLGLPVDAVDVCLSFTAINGSGPDDDIFTIRNESGIYLVYGEMEYDTELCIPAPANDNLLLNIYSYCLIQKTNEAFTTSSDPQTSLNFEVDQSFTSYSLEGAFLDCNGGILNNEIDVSILGTYRFNSAQSFSGTYNLELDECVNIERSKMIFFDSENKVISELDLSTLQPGTNITNITLCQDDVSESFVELDGLALSGCNGRQNKEETLLTLDDESSLFIMGIDGFEVGEFTCRILLSSEGYEGRTIITSYGGVNETIEGTMTVTNISDPNDMIMGSFVAKRIK